MVGRGVIDLHDERFASRFAVVRLIVVGGWLRRPGFPFRLAFERIRLLRLKRIIACQLHGLGHESLIGLREFLEVDLDGGAVVLFERNLAPIERDERRFDLVLARGVGPSAQLSPGGRGRKRQAKKSYYKASHQCLAKTGEHNRISSTTRQGDS